MISSLPWSRKAAPIQVGRVPFANLSRGGGSAWSNIPFWGDGLEGYDSLSTSGLIDYDRDIGEYSENSVVAACLGWIITSWGSSVLQVGTMQGSEFVPDATEHPMIKLIQSPHPDYDGSWLWTLLLSDLWTGNGNHYWNIVRGGPGGTPVEIQFLPGSMTYPYSSGMDASRLIDEYRYSPGIAPISIPVDQVIHFPYYMASPTDPRVGRRPLYATRREIYADNKASDVAAAILRKPRPSGILTPDGSDVEVSQEDLNIIKRTAEEMTSGQNSGSMLGLSAAIRYTKLSYDPKELSLDEARRKPEERICAIFGLPPVVIGMGAGLDRSTYSNMAEARKAAWQDCMIPLQDYIASILTKKLLPMFPGSDGKIAMFDRSQVGVLQADINAARLSAREDVKAGIITIEEARGEGGRSATPTEGILLPPQTQTTLSPIPTKAFKVASPQARVYRAADTYRSALLADEMEALTEMASAYNKVHRDVAARLRVMEGYIASLQSEGMSVPAQVAATAERLNALIPQIEAQLSDFADRGAAITESGQRAMILTATNNAEPLARAALGSAPPGVSLAWNKLPTEMFEVLVGMSGNHSPVADLFASASAEYAQELRDTILSGVAMGRNPKDVARQAAARTGASRARMETICRTEMLRAAREATRRTYEANSDVVKGYIRLSAADSRTCPACWALHGTKSATAERFAQHPSDRCVMVPEVRSYAEILGDPSIPDTRPEMPTGEELFAKLSSSEQEAILGPGLHDLYQQGVPLSDFAVRSYDAEWGPTLGVSTVANATSRSGVVL